MLVELAGSNVVIAAHHFNPSIFSQLWLVRNGIVGEEEFRPGCVFSDQAANIASESFDLLVIPPQLQFMPKVPSDQQGDLVAAKVGAVVGALPHTPYSAIGMNFFWHVELDDSNVQSFTRSLFFDPSRKICQHFDSEDARFGAYFSRDALGCRLKLDIKPITRHTGEESTELVQFAFNFHLDLPETGNQTVPTIENQLRIWDAARVESARTVKQVTE